MQRAVDQVGPTLKSVTQERDAAIGSLKALQAETTDKLKTMTANHDKFVAPLGEKNEEINRLGMDRDVLATNSNKFHGVVNVQSKKIESLETNE